MKLVGREYWNCSVCVCVRVSVVFLKISSDLLNQTFLTKLCRMVYHGNQSAMQKKNDGLLSSGSTSLPGFMNIIKI